MIQHVSLLQKAFLADVTRKKVFQCFSLHSTFLRKQVCLNIKETYFHTATLLTAVLLRSFTCR